MLKVPSPDQTLHTGTMLLRCGQPARIPYRVRFLGTDDLPALEAFRSHIFDLLPDLDAYFPETPDFAGLHLGDRGVTLGMEAEGRLVGCGILGLPRPGLPAFVEDLPHDRPSVQVTAHMASCMIHPDFRGNGLQGLFLTLRTLYAMGAGRPHLFARVALSNPVSLANLMGEGFLIRRVLVMHSGRLRYLLHRDMRASPPAWEAGSERVLPRSDLDGQRAAIEAGFLGRAVDIRGAEPVITYARPIEALIGDESPVACGSLLESMT